MGDGWIASFGNLGGSVMFSHFGIGIGIGIKQAAPALRAARMEAPTSLLCSIERLTCTSSRHITCAPERVVRHGTLEPSIFRPFV
jgi:hypothetical protein